ncbi:hypothetical protein [Bradyrhizobium sp. SRL28]|uniref:hypothetical protein n=1 Tax=Bradyrhizobium sp. SRL28 TaxID=2836178 RepID=UPI0035B38C81
MRPTTKSVLPLMESMSARLALKKSLCLFPCRIRFMRSASPRSSPALRRYPDGGLPDSHWSEDKQRALGQQFLETAIRSGNLGIRRIHLFLAAQNSVVFPFRMPVRQAQPPRIDRVSVPKGSEPALPVGYSHARQRTPQARNHLI